MIQVVTVHDVGPTMNKFYAGIHYKQRKKIKDTWVFLVGQAVKDCGTEPVSTYPVSIDCKLIFGPKLRRFDWDNAAATAKLFQDGLVKKGILEGDSAKFVSGGRIWCTRGPHTKTIIMIREGPDALLFP